MSPSLRLRISPRFSATETFPNAPAFPDGEIVTYTYNGAGWLKSVSGYINDITYNGRGQKTALTYANGVTTTWAYFVSGSLINFMVKDRLTGTANSLQDLHYTYDNVGNVTSISDLKWTGTRGFQYDDLNRLTFTDGTYGANQAYAACGFSYNAIGNMTDKCGVTYSYTDSLHPSAATSRSDGKTYTYNNNGNMLTGAGKTFTWDVENRLSAISVPGVGSTSYQYDYTGIRVHKNAPTGITIYPFKGYEIDPSGTVTKFIRIGNETFASKRGSAKYYYHNDHLGGVNVISNASGLKDQLSEYGPWGNVSRQEGTSDPTHRFTGQELDPESGIYYYGGRYYDPVLARFTSPDPFVKTEPSDPQSLNRYSYVINNPVNLVDPDGFFFGGSWRCLRRLSRQQR